MYLRNAGDTVFIDRVPFSGETAPTEKLGRISPGIRWVNDHIQAGMGPALLAVAVNSVDWHPVRTPRSEVLEGYALNCCHFRAQSGIPYHESGVI
jgi:hypothetical protein